MPCTSWKRHFSLKSVCEMFHYTQVRNDYVARNTLRTLSHGIIAAFLEFRLKPINKAENLPWECLTDNQSWFSGIAALSDKEGHSWHWRKHGQVFSAQKISNENNFHTFSYSSKSREKWFYEVLWVSRWEEQIKGWKRNRWCVSKPVLANRNASENRDASWVAFVEENDEQK